MSKANSSDTQNFRARDRRFTALPVKDVLKIRMKDLGIKNIHLQKAFEYPMPNVIAMMKSGSMRMPANKVVVAARLLQIDPVFLLSKVVSENDPDLWDVISALLGDHLVTANEISLLRFVRQGLDGHDVNLAESPGFTDVAGPALKVILERQNALAQAAKNRTDE